MIVREKVKTKTIVVVKMTKEQRTLLQTALSKVEEFDNTSTGYPGTLNREEAEVITDLRQSLLNS